MEIAGFGALLLLWTVSAAADLQGDATALLGIKEQLAGRGNPVFSTWISGTPCCEWEGVTCSDGRVTALNLEDKGLNGAFPDELGNLTSLESLNLRLNSIKGPIPSSFSALSSLKAIELSGNPLFGEFPEPILKIKSLVNLRLGSCNLTGKFPDVQQLPLLQNLVLPSNNITGPIPDLSKLPIYELNLWGLKLVPGWNKTIGSLTNLKSLNLHSCGLEGQLPAEWGSSLRKLEVIYLYDNKLTGSIPDSWGELKNLTKLRLDRNRLTGSVPAWFSASHLNRTGVYIYCNYLSGNFPQGYPIMNIKGNCFQNGNLRDHGSECTDGPCKYPRKNRAGLIIALVGSLAAAFVLIGAALFVWKCRRPKGIVYKDDETGEQRRWEAPAGVEQFELKLIVKATNGFSGKCEIGSGGFGKVYRGTLSDGRVVAIKKASDISTQGHREFLNEITLLSRLHHRNLVPLIGFCHDKKHQVLVYEFMESGNLHHLLLGKHSGRCLDWYKRLEIAIAVAEGLDYLHSFADPPVIHRDLKPSNVLLDGSLVAKIADFGISKVSMDTHVSTGPAGTAGYLDPDYFIRRQLTTASDVYAYGIVLLELITGQKAIDQKRVEEFNLLEWVKPRLESQGIRSIVDHRLGDDFPEAMFEVLAKMALNCAAFDRTQRPSMKNVLATLTSFRRISEPSGDDTATSTTWTSSSCDVTSSTYTS